MKFPTPNVEDSMVTACESVERSEAAADLAFVAFLAALYRQGMKQMSSADDLLHKSFRGALAVLREDTDASQWFRDYRASSTSGRYEALDRAIIRAEQYGLVQFPNPSYTKVRLALSPVDAENILGELGDARPLIEKAAEEFRRVYQEYSW